MKNRTDKLLVSVYALHGDTCSLAPHCKPLGCASGFDSTDYVLSAKFAYLQEALDYADSVVTRGVHVRVVSRIVPTIPFIREYSPKSDARDCTCADRSWYGAEHDSACPLEGVRS